MSGGQGGNDGWGAPGFQPAMNDSTPDWAAMAEATEREARRKRRMRIVLSVVGVLVVAGMVATAVVLRGTGDKKPSADDQPVASAPNCIAPSPAGSKGANDVRLGAGTHVGTIDGHSGLALTLRGSADGYAEADSVVVNTCTSFTVSAVVRNNAPEQPRAILSQGSDGFFSFYLGRDFRPGHNQWVFKVQTAAESGKAVLAEAPGSVPIGEWTTLTGVYDAKAGSIALYVNGALAMTTPVSGILSTNGPIEIGRARFKSHWADAWDGSIADVQIWDQALTPEGIAQVAKDRSTDVAARATWFRF
ncbi:LamG domain-containing protein [Kitasatospora sp. NPDC048540]|uniref:LamG domain-containing protein n=1 Tax=unclassified Kitasatospora TaxID=2633591 RepID=UPI00053B4CB2|nr:LamG domain-containing protein [Kitasatospora sp. MBT63]